MAYVRWGDDGSDVYVYSNGEGIICCCCDIQGGESACFVHRKDAIAHFRQHQDLDDCVPECVFDRLEWELENLGNVVYEDPEDGYTKHPYINAFAHALKVALDSREPKNLNNGSRET